MTESKTTRVKLSKVAIQNNIGKMSSKERLGTISPWGEPSRHTHHARVLWDGRKWPENYAIEFLEIVK